MTRRKELPSTDGAGRRMYRWTVQIAVSETWVEDGFQLDDERAEAMLLRDLAYAHGHEVACRVISKPLDEDVAKAQGYKSVEAFRRDNRYRARITRADADEGDVKPCGEP